MSESLICSSGSAAPLQESSLLRTLLAVSVVHMHCRNLLNRCLSATLCARKRHDMRQKTQKTS
eukprot:2350167-Rhodomonas_salina.1